MKRYLFGLLLLLVSCNAATNNKHLERGRADVVALEEGGTVRGTVDFVEVAEGLRIFANIQGLSPGKHGIHVHEYGDLSDQGMAAGGHYNPDDVKHGFVVEDGFKEAHPGDFGNLTADENGDAELELFVPGLRLSGGKYNIAGRAIIIHEDEDDFSQPTGDAGDRIGGGVIIITK